MLTKAGRTPAVLAAFIIFLSQVSFCCGYYLPGVVIVVLCVGTAAAAIVLGCSDAGASLLMAAVFSVLLAIPVIDNASCAIDAPTGYGSYRIYVTSAQQKLDGKRRLYGKTMSGILVSSVLPVEAVACYPADIIEIEGELEIPSVATNPGEFDYKSYLSNRGITRTVNAESVRVISRGGILAGAASFAEEKRLSFIGFFTSGMDRDTMALASALLFGDRSLLGDDISRKFTVTGLNHLAAVSGTHFSGFLILFPALMSLAGVRDRRITGTVYVIFCIFIGFLTSWTESVTRAAFMNICSFFGRDSLSSMSIAAILIIFSDPYSVLSQGFLMSYAACLAIKCIVPRIRGSVVKIVIDLIRQTPWRGICTHRFEIRVSKAVSVFAVFIGCSLMMCLFSGSVEVRIGPAMMLINVIATLLVSFICACFMPAALLCCIWSVFASGTGPARLPLTFMLELFKAFIYRVSEHAYSSIGISCSPRYLIITLVIFIILALLPRCILKKLLFTSSCLALCAALGIYGADVIKYGAVKIVFVDVGQGDCALVMSGGKTALIDGGIADEGMKTLPTVLDHYNIDKVDYAIMSHWDSDHVGGLLSLAGQGRVRRLYSPYTVCDEQVCGVLSDSLGLSPSECNMFLADNVTGINNNDTFTLSDSCRIRVVAPDLAASGGNEDSAVLILEACGTKIMFTGDIGIDTEDKLAAAGRLPDIDILKVAHHGSRFSTGTGFLSAVKAECAVISVAADNPYGHPAPATLDRLTSAGCRVCRTSISGAITVDIGRSGYRITCFIPDTG